MNAYQENPFVFSKKFRLIRHFVFWIVHIIIFTYIFRQPESSFAVNLLMSFIWALLFILYIYPILYKFIPRYLFEGKQKEFLFIMLLWGLIGWFWNYFCRTYIFFPVADHFQFGVGARNNWAPSSYLTMCAMAGLASMIVLMKYWIKKQNDFLRAEKEKALAELQLLKAQIHPHFLFNTLNNIYSYSLQNSEKTPQLILKLSSLLSYILYDCNSDKVLLEKEMEIMKNYIDLELERYGNRIDISINIEGDIINKIISPLLLLPFLENAFKHGTSELLEKPWLSMDINIKKNIMRCKIVNSKNDLPKNKNPGIGIENLRKRLELLYAGRHELKINDENDFFIVSLLLELDPHTTKYIYDKSKNSESIKSI